MEIPQFTNLELIRELEYTNRQIKTLMSTKKQIETEISKRYDEGRLGNGNEEGHI